MGTPKTKITTDTRDGLTGVPDYLTEAYKNLFQQASNASNQPWQDYGGQRVAGFGGDAQAAFRAIRGLPNVGRADFNQARRFAGQAGQAITGRVPGVTQDYMNPYLEEVVGNAQRDFEHSDAVAQNDLLGRAISSGASPFGGDRAGVAAAELYRNQADTRNTALGGLRASGYQNAQQAALAALQGDQSAAGTASQLFSGLGTNAFNQASQSANALLTSGLTQQQNQQAGLDANFAEFMRHQGFDWDKISKYASALRGTPNLGSTEYGKDTKEEPGPSPWNALIGLIGPILGALPLGGGPGGGNASYGDGWGGYGQSGATGFDRGGSVRHARDGLSVSWEHDRRPGSSVDKIWDLPHYESPPSVTPESVAGLGAPPPAPPKEPPVVVNGGQSGVGAPVPSMVSGRQPAAMAGEARPGTVAGLIADSPLRYGLIAGGLATMGSESPWPLTALGQGMSFGLKAAMERRGDIEARDEKRREFDATRESEDEYRAKTLALQQAQLDAQGTWEKGKNGNFWLLHPGDPPFDTGVPFYEPPTAASNPTENEGTAKMAADATGKPPNSPEWVKAYQDKMAQLKGVGAGLAVDSTGRPLDDPPEGMAWKIGPDGKVPLDENGAPVAVLIGGSPAAIKAEKDRQAADAAAGKEDLNAARTARSGERVTNLVKDALTQVYAPGPVSAIEGLFGGTPSNVGAVGTLIGKGPFVTNNSTLANTVHTIQRNVGVDQLNQMRQAAANGASGFGALTEKEMPFITGLFGELEGQQDPVEYTKSLARIYNEYNRLAFMATSDTDPKVRAEMEAKMPPSLPETGLTGDDVKLYSQLLAIPGITEAEIVHNMQKFSKTREEVIRAAVERYGRGQN